MLTKRIIPCLDVRDGKVVKGKNFINLKYAGEPTELARRYWEMGADEVVFLDITATIEKRKTLVETVKKVAKELFIPFSIGGGINSTEAISELLKCGADKVSLNTAAVKNSELIKAAAEEFGSQCIIVAVDVKRTSKGFEVMVESGKKKTGIGALEWIKECEKRGAGELLITSVDFDGTQKGFDIEFLKKASETVNIPVIASGGAGKKEDFLEVFKKTGVDAALAASTFHYKQILIPELKEYLKENGVNVRC